MFWKKACCLGILDTTCSSLIKEVVKSQKIMLIGFLKGDGSLVQSILGPPWDQYRFWVQSHWCAQVETPAEPQLHLRGMDAHGLSLLGSDVGLQNNNNGPLILSKQCQQKSKELGPLEYTKASSALFPTPPAHQNKHKNKHHGSKSKRGNNQRL